MGMPMVKIFISYSHDDSETCTALVASFAPLIEKGVVKLTFDGGLTPGDDYFGRLEAMINDADIVLFLVSQASLASSAAGIELRYALTRLQADHSGTALRIVPIILDHCAWKDTPLGAFQCLPSGKKPVSEYDDPSEVLREIAAAVGIFATAMRAPQRSRIGELFDDGQVFALREEVKKAMAAIQETIVGPTPSIQVAILLKRQEEKLKSLTEELRARLGQF